MNLKSTSKLLKKCTELESKPDSDRSVHNQNDKKQLENHFNIIENEKENIILENSENESHYFDKEIIVGKFNIIFYYYNLLDQSSDINSIQKAVDIAEPHTIIKIQSGVYRENIIIK